MNGIAALTGTAGALADVVLYPIAGGIVFLGVGYLVAAYFDFLPGKQKPEREVRYPGVRRIVERGVITYRGKNCPPEDTHRHMTALSAARCGR